MTLTIKKGLLYIRLGTKGRVIEFPVVVSWLAGKTTVSTIWDIGRVG